MSVYLAYIQYSTIHSCPTSYNTYFSFIKNPVHSRITANSLNRRLPDSKKNTAPPLSVHPGDGYQGGRVRASLVWLHLPHPLVFSPTLYVLCMHPQDSGVRAFVSGLAVASSEIMIGSSLNDPGTKAVPAAGRCQKPYSGYITLITEWREEILHKPEESVIRIFPFEYPPPSEEAEEPEVDVHVQEDEPAEGQQAPEPMGGP